MAAVMAERAIRGEGTTEAEWRAWSDLAQIPCVAVCDLVPAGHRLVVVAPHPDDEVLAAGGLLAQLAAMDRLVLRVAATDGTASHPGSTDWTVQRLASVRPAESAEAWQRLGFAPTTAIRLALQDGAMAQNEARLIAYLLHLLTPRDVVLTTCRFDGHPDHEATARACAKAAWAAGCRVIEAPVWAWHWGEIADPRIPWRRARRLMLGDDAIVRKCHALAAFTSQLTVDASTHRPPILPSTTLARAQRDFELFFL